MDGFTALIASKSRTGGEALAAFASGGVVGLVSSALPDGIEPADHPNHRRFAHSWTVVAGVTAATVKSVKPARAVPGDGSQAQVVVQPEFAQRLARALIPAAGAGYLSHLALDAATPKGLPLL